MDLLKLPRWWCSCISLEMSQNSLRLSWTQNKEADGRLKDIIQTSSTLQKQLQKLTVLVLTTLQVNTAAFENAANAMIAQGSCLKINIKKATTY